LVLDAGQTRRKPHGIETTRSTIISTGDRPFGTFLTRGQSCPPSRKKKEFDGQKGVKRRPNQRTKWTPTYCERRETEWFSPRGTRGGTAKGDGKKVRKKNYTKGKSGTLTGGGGKLGSGKGYSIQNPAFPPKIPLKGIEEKKKLQTGRTVPCLIGATSI